MGFIVGLIFIMFLCGCNTLSREQYQQKRAEWGRLEEDHHRAQKAMAERYDFYYKRQSLASRDVNNMFYSDGSLLQDSRTGRYFKKGEYFCNGYGYDADGNKVPDSMPRPPQTRF